MEGVQRRLTEEEEELRAQEEVGGAGTSKHIGRISIV